MKHKQMSRTDAILEIAFDFYNRKPTRTSYGRMVRSMKVLGLTPEEAKQILFRLQYADFQGNVFPKFLKHDKKEVD